MKFKGDFLKNIKQIQSQLQSVIDLALADAAQQGAQIAKDNINSHSPNGLIAKTHPYRTSPLSHGIIADAKYASWVEYGNGSPGSRIYPNSAKALRFVIDGQVIFAKSVKASTPRPFMGPALQFEQANLTNIISTHLNQFFKSIGK